MNAFTPSLARPGSAEPGPLPAADSSPGLAHDLLSGWLVQRISEEFARPLPKPDRPLSPADRDARMAQAVRAFQLGMEEAAYTLVFDLVKACPGWADGHVRLAQFMAQSGAREAFEAFLSARVEHAGPHIGIVASCLRMLSDTGLHDSVQRLLPGLRTRIGDHLFFTILEALAASETGDLDRADALFDRTLRDGAGLSLPHIAHLIRRGRAADAAAMAEQFIQIQPANQAGWCMLATAWRMTGDARHAWLVEQPGLTRIVDLDVAPASIDALATLLRSMHIARAHPFDQSLRGGTQTGGFLLRRKEPEIRMIRHALTSAMRNHVNQLPPHDAKHPLLGLPRGAFHFSDSWSVRLIDGGWHVSHCHSAGALSSAFYVTLPPPCPVDPQAGWLTIGEPPEDLCTGLPPLAMVEPAVGRLAVFPSYMWHGTRPFPHGERMTIAFDTLMSAPEIRLPRGE